MWRPNNWKEIVVQYYPDCDIDTEERKAVSDFEDGADAILDALIKKTGRFTLDHETTQVRKDGAFSGVILESGWEVFIPREVKNDSNSVLRT